MLESDVRMIISAVRALEDFLTEIEYYREDIFFFVSYAYYFGAMDNLWVLGRSEMVGVALCV